MFKITSDKLDSNTKQILGAFFDRRDVLEAYRFIEEERINISFRKGDVFNYFIVSGIVRDDSIVEGRISCKTREGRREIQSQCSCLKWTAEEHCSHVASLFIKFHLQDQATQNLPKRKRDSTILGRPAGVGEYGTVIAGPERLQGMEQNLAAFAPQPDDISQSYFLVNQTRVPLPFPKAFQGKICIKLCPTYKFYIRNQIETSPGEALPDSNLLTARFSYITVEGKQVDEVNLFDCLYLFDWVHSDCYHLPRSFVDFIKIVRKHPEGMTINDYLRLTRSVRSSDIVSLSLEDANLAEIPQTVVRPTVFLGEGKRAGYLDLSISFSANEAPDRSESTSLVLFDELSSFAFEGGLLDSFKKKFEAYEFVENIPTAVELGPQHLIKFLRLSDDRDQWERVVDSLFADQNFESYDEVNRRICLCQSSIIRQLLAHIITCFDVPSLRYSSVCRESKKLSLQIRKSKLLENISNFCEKIFPLGIEVYFNKSKVETWKSKVRCQRNDKRIDWFEIDLEITQKDLEILKKANWETGQFFNSNEIILFNQEQKELLRFFKKYIRDSDLPDKIPGREGQKQKISLPFERAQIFELFELKKSGLEGVLTEEEVQFCERLLNLKEIPQYDLPSKLQGHLRPYQADAYRWLRFLWENRFGACLADDMGLGKTIQTISFLQSIIHQINHVLIVCPVSILVNWEEEFQKFSDLSDDICLYYGGDRELDLSKKIILTSHGVMKREAGLKLREIPFDVMVLDEVQNFKNIRSLGAERVRKIRARFRICLTGTPVENDISEFYNILDIAVPGIWGRRELTKSRDIGKSRFLAKRTARPFVLRRTKSQVLKDLPDKIENTVFLRFSDQEKERYLYQLSAIRKRLEHVPAKKRYGEVFKGLLELRQLCLWQQQNVLYSTKIKLLFKNLEQILQEQHQVLIFSQFTSYLDIIEKNLVQRGITFSRIDGSYSIKKRSENIKLFQSGEHKVFIISLKAGGVGLNLTAASYVYIMDPWWNPAVEAQAVDRAHRIGQKKSINVYRLIIKNSIEEKVLELQKIKKELFDDLLGNENDQYFTGKLSMKDFETLLS